MSPPRAPAAPPATGTAGAFSSPRRAPRADEGRTGDQLIIDVHEAIHGRQERLVEMFAWPSRQFRRSDREVHRLERFEGLLARFAWQLRPSRPLTRSGTMLLKPKLKNTNYFDPARLHIRINLTWICEQLHATNVLNHQSDCGGNLCTLPDLRARSLLALRALPAALPLVLAAAPSRGGRLLVPPVGGGGFS